ncbi:MAG: ABC transporter ATP-binding protein [Candidatus Helarchaeota archaeon]
MNEKPLVFENLTKLFQKTVALDDLNEKIPKGIVGFIGPNGAGKTTTIKILMGLLRPTSGTAYIFGRDILREGIEIRKVVGYLPERNALFLNKTACSFLGYLSRIYGLSKTELNLRIKEVLEIVGIEKQWWNKKLKKFSSGMRQRVSLARAILNPNIKLVILDEPTINLDPLGRNFFLNLIKKLNKEEKIDFFISSHVLSELEQVSKHVVIINRGKIITSKPITELRHFIKKNVFKIKTSDNTKVLAELNQQKEFDFQVVENKSFLKIQTEDSLKLKSVIPQIVVKNKLVLDVFEEVEMDLEEIFLQSINKKEDVTH